MNVFLGDEVTLLKQEAVVTGRVNGLKLNKGRLEIISIEDIDFWFSLEAGWKLVDDLMEEDDLDD